jgi:tetratricopeptide (TPR) repeat protein
MQPLKNPKENPMIEDADKVKEIENQIEKALWDLELHDELDQALEVYRAAELKLEGLGITAENPAYGEQQRVLSYCLMRQGNILRQKEKPDEARALGEREIAAARNSGDGITLARSLMSNGTNYIVTGEISTGLGLIEEARRLLEKGDSYDHQQALGWYWILQADLANAGLVKTEPAEVIEFATRALDILEPIENWPGVARAYAARAKAYERQGDEEMAVKDRQEQKVSESKIEPGEEGAG